MSNASLIFGYGVKMEKSMLYDLAVQHGTTDIYEAVMKAGLDYRIIGHASYGHECVLGKFIPYPIDTCLTLDDTPEGLATYDLDSFDITETYKALRAFGVGDMHMDYHLFVSIL